MNPEVKLGYDRIRGQIEELCTTKGAIEHFSGERFSNNERVVTRRLRLADQMRQVLMMEKGFPEGEYYDTDEVLEKIEVDGIFLDVEEIVQIKMALETVNDLISFFKNKDQEQYPDLISMTRNVVGFPEIVNHIDSIVDKHGKIKDSASPELFRIRRTIRDRESQASKQLQRILLQAQKSGIAEADATISIRDGRAVIPVMSSNKRKLKGFIQDESATGLTTYIEPIEVVELNNELRELQYSERREIIRILVEFTEMIRPELPMIAKSGKFLTTMDMIRAKAKFALKNDCVMPIVSHDERLELRQARHLLLEQALKKEKRDIVPLDLQLNRQKHILVISGPNAGGKSVCLKTVGLIQWMFQCGVLVPLLENSELPLFDDLFIDIGDEQSIDNDLSTYSSHLHNMKRMLQRAGSNSLLLIDEFGTGTEPVIGGAIAESMLERFESKGCFGVITTHYSNLKYYASNAKGVVNGAMTFDVQNIQPLFKLEMGTPGSSFAIEIARKIGLPEDLIHSASEKAGTDHIDLERQLREIARDKSYWERKRSQIRRTDKRVEELELHYEEQLSDIKSQRADILKKARTEAELITAEANKQIENVIKTIRESQADKDLTRLARQELDEFKEALEKEKAIEDKAERDKITREMERLIARKKRREERRAQRGEAKPQEVRKKVVRLDPEVGSKVRMKGQDFVGEVQDIRGGKATVAFGHILTTVDVGRLNVISGTEYKKETRPTVSTINLGSEISQRRLAFKSSIDIRGERVSEALDSIRDFIDDAIMVGVGEVTILHGKGTGALREEVRKYLKSVDAVQSFQDEHPDRGGAGITIVKIGL